MNALTNAELIRLLKKEPPDLPAMTVWKWPHGTSGIASRIVGVIRRVGYTAVVVEQTSRERVDLT